MDYPDIMAAKNPGLVDGWLWLLRMPSGDWRIVTNRLYLAEKEVRLGHRRPPQQPSGGLVPP